MAVEETPSLLLRLTGRIRPNPRFSPVRLAVNAVVLLGAYIGIQLAVVAGARAMPADAHDTVVVAGFVALAPIMLVVYSVLVRVVERRPAREIVFVPGLALAGVLSGAGLFLVVYSALWLLGRAHWSGLSSGAALGLPLAIAIASAVGEELTFRGGIFRVLEDSFGTTIAVIVSAAVFGLMHALNPGATAVSTAAIAIEAGVLLGMAYVATRNLWLPIGLHFGWNFTEGGIFGAAVSGRDYNGLIHVSLSGPDWLTGGKFGPEASIVAVLVSVVLSAILLAITLRRGGWKPIGFRLLLAA
jgi:membrane protease YdiL (CAAX protease family)